MPTIDRVEGFAIRIYLNDHAPAYVHVVKAGCLAIIQIGTPAAVREVHGMGPLDLRRAVRIVEARSEIYHQHWRSIHGG